MDDGDRPVTSLLDAAAAGDEHAWDEIVDRYAPLLASVIHRFRLGTAETQDVAQTVWLRLAGHLGSLGEPRALRLWIIATGRQESLRHLSHGRRTPPSGHPDPLWPAAPAEDAEPDAELPRAELHEVLLAGLAELPARQRELLLLLVEDPTLSCDQISRRTGIPVDGTGPTRGRALERLRQTLAVSDHLAGQARAPAPPDGAARFGSGTPRDLDRPRGRLPA